MTERKEHWKKSAHCKYGGWSRDGTACFSELYNLMTEDRSCPEAEAMETELLAFWKKEMGGAAMVVEQEAVVVEAAWDLDDDDHWRV
jgi:hypothetical protein